MKVQDLIALLQTQNPDATVVVNLEKNELANGLCALTVKVEKAFHFKDRPNLWHKDLFGVGDNLDDDENEDCIYGEVVNVSA
jgi:hypothetical protein